MKVSNTAPLPLDLLPCFIDQQKNYLFSSVLNVLGYNPSIFFN